ncbi:MAG: hypothetical protein HY859_06900 [Caulobacterales bacterium]|nr:hypothetical protein [Caulobacterales bacterium]
MADAPKARAPRKRASAKPVPAPAPEAPTPVITYENLKARADELAAQRASWVQAKAQAEAQIVAANLQLSAFDGAQQVVDELMKILQPAAT